ncbi:tetratricopeptide [Candidatus Scalindua japonica]|uniref:Tetratricopeptide n=1 Tax=Candidatus Scalindua japonica TaxID=1284222 RepID=A0A286TXR4_9BACT|nr:hypothetical protein [Candidatus Scalindua japonica]GAX60672.1 tetratricopeptide [Candidatus Scalindua japonica]
MDELENRQKLNRYIKEENNADALKLLDSTSLSPVWCHLAVPVYVAIGKESLAIQTIVWAKENADILVWRRCIYEFAKADWKRIFGHDPKGIIVLPDKDTQNRKEDVDKILEVMQPVLLHIEGDECVSSKLEAEILFIAFNAFWLLGNIEKVRKLAYYLETMQPASIGLANLAMMGLVKPGSLKSNFPERLNKENPDSFNAKMLSQLLKAELFEQSKSAFESLKAFSPGIEKEDRLRYCQGLFHVAQFLGEPAITECIKLSEELIGKENSFCKLAKAECLLNSDDIDGAEKIAESCKDEENPQWLQIYAFIQAKKEKFEDAIKYYEEASRLMAHPEVFATLGRLATLASEKDDKFRNNIIDAYKSLLELEPDNLSARHNLAFELARSGRIQEAKEHFEYLLKHTSEDDPSAINYKQNYGNCLMLTGDPAGALVIYDDICSNKDAPVEAIINKTKLLKQLNDPFISFEFLQQYRKDYWNTPSYLQCYMEVSSQANQDGLMHEALMQLKKLKLEGKVSGDLIKQITLEDIIEHGKQWNERTRQIHNFCLKGEMPWSLADDMLKHAIYMGWIIRTQELNWINDEPATIASYSIYATNCFHPLKYDNGKVYLKKLDKPLSNSEVVMDITALITLHRLDLIDKAKDFFKTIYVPTLYLSKLSMDSDKLLPHQYSNVKSICKIKEAIDSERIHVLGELETLSNSCFPYINEHTSPEDKEHYYRLVDILDALEKYGLVRTRELEDIKKITLMHTGVDEHHPEINKDDKLIIELSSLKTICNYDLFDTVLNNFDVKLTSESKKQVLSDFSHFEHQKKVKNWNNDLFNIISSESIIKVDLDLDEKNRENFSMTALKLSIQMNLPLYSDDRCLQVAALNDKTQIGVFGTDIFTEALYSQKHIDLEVLTDIYLTLIDWRFKFVILPLDVMEYLAEQYLKNQPGSALKKIAMYIHDCMRDPGLFYGLEKAADVPLSMAMKLYMEWLRLTADFIVKCWNNPKFDDGVADTYTDWAILSMLPTIPKYLTGGGYNLASMTKSSLLKTAITQLMLEGNIDKGNKVLLVLKQKLELSDVEYNRVVLETIDAI